MCLPSIRTVRYINKWWPRRVVWPEWWRSRQISGSRNIVNAIAMCAFDSKPLDLCYVRLRHTLSHVNHNYILLIVAVVSGCVRCARSKIDFFFLCSCGCWRADGRTDWLTPPFWPGRRAMFLSAKTENVLFACNSCALQILAVAVTRGSCLVHRILCTYYYYYYLSTASFHSFERDPQLLLSEKVKHTHTHSGDCVVSVSHFIRTVRGCQ